MRAWYVPTRLAAAHRGRSPAPQSAAAPWYHRAFMPPAGHQSSQDSPLDQADFSAASCQRFIDATAGRPMPETLIRALAMAPPIHAGARALELGCGAGDDAVALAQRGYHVTVVDEFTEATESAAARADAAGVREHIDLHPTPFESFDFEPAAFDVVHARFSLPFCTPDAFDRVWAGLRRSIRPGGIFAGDFFGPRDTFVLDPKRTRIVSHDRAAVEALLESMTILELQEDEKDGVTATGRAKHWHVFHVLARHGAPPPNEESPAP